VRGLGARPEAGDVLRLQHAQDLLHGDGAGARRAHAAERIGAIAAADRRALLDLVGVEVVERHVAGIVLVAGDRRDDVLRDLALIEGVGAAPGDGAQRRGEGRVLQDGADRLRLAVGLVEIGGGAGVLAEVLFQCEQAVEARRDRKALLGQLDRRREDLGPGQLAPALMSFFEQPDRAGHADRAATDHGVDEFHRLAIGAEESLGLGRLRRGLAPVERGQTAAGLVPIDEEGAAADAGALRLDQVEHELDRDRRIGCAAAGAQDLPAGRGGERVGGSGHVALRRAERLGGAAGRGFRRGSDGLGRSCCCCREPKSKGNDRTRTDCGRCKRHGPLLFLGGAD
jgi:hypothetical protein